MAELDLSAVREQQFTNYERTFQFDSPTTLITYSKKLNLSVANPDYNLFTRWGFIGTTDGSLEGTSVIAKFGSITGGKVQFYHGNHKTGEGYIGENANLREDDEMESRVHDELASIDFHSKGERIGTDYANAIATKPMWQRSMQRFTQWATHHEFEMWMITTTGIRGNNTCYEAFNTPQADVAIDLWKSSDYWRTYNDRIPIGRRNRVVSPHVAYDKWTKDILGYNRYSAEDPDAESGINMTLPGYLASDFYHTGPEGADLSNDADNNHIRFEFLSDLYTHCKTINRQADGFDFKPAMLNFPKDLTEQKARNPQEGSYILFLNTESARTLRSTAEWQKHQVNLMQDLGLHTGITTGFLGQFNNIILAENQFVPTFTKTTGTGNTKKTYHWSRNLLFGQMATMYGYNTYNVPVQYRASKNMTTVSTAYMKSPWRVRVVGVNRNDDSAIIAKRNGGFKTVRWNKPSPTNNEQTFNPEGTISAPYDENKKVDRGIICIDTLDKVVDHQGMVIQAPDPTP